MKTEKNILIAFVLNLAFSVFEFIGGIFTGSVSIMSDALHDAGDAASIGISYFLEKKSKRRPDDIYTYGYARYSVMGSVISSTILLLGSLVVIYNAVIRIIKPVEIDYSGMIIFAIVGTAVNLLAAIVTSGSESMNQKAVNLHMLEDVLGWVVVLIGAIIMNFTDINVIDPIMSIGVALFILVNAVKALHEAAEVFLERVPDDIDVTKITDHIARIDGIHGVHHVHVWSMDGQNSFATLHVVSEDHSHSMKKKIKDEFHEHGISHVTIEFESLDEECRDTHCHIEAVHSNGHHHHH